MLDKAYDRRPTERSRALRNNPTEAEQKLWSAIRNRQLGGVRFNRQVSSGPFICDFVARGARLIIELDGGQHAIEVARDESRSHYLRREGYRVVRFWNNDVIGNIKGVLMTIAEALGQTPSRSTREEKGRRPEGAGLSETGSPSADMPSPDPSRKREGGK